eukprot:3121633-Rhodomonas_salina.2
MGKRREERALLRRVWAPEEGRELSARRGAEGRKRGDSAVEERRRVEGRKRDERDNAGWEES